MTGRQTDGSPIGNGAPLHQNRDDLWWAAEEARLHRAGEADDAALAVLRGVRRIELGSRRLVQDIFSGEYHSAFKGQGMEFSEVREYVPGDDVRTIDRNVSARMQHPFVKIFHEERELSVIFIVDQSGSSRFGSGAKTRAEVAAELVAVLAFSAISNGDKVGCCLFTDHVEKWVAPGKGKSHVLRVVREVLFGQPVGRGTHIASGLEMVARVQKRRSIVFVLSDFLDDGFGTSLAVLSRRHEVIPLVLIDPAERELPDVGLVEMEDLETGERRLVDTSDARTRADHAEACERRLKVDLPASMQKAGVVPVYLPLDGDYVQPLHRYFQMRMKRRAQGR